MTASTSLRTARQAPGITHDLARLLLHVQSQGSIAAAARALDIDPSLATRKIAQLEAIFDARLFERTTRRLKLTQAGAIALRCAQHLCDSVDGAREDISALLREPSGMVRIAASQFFSMALLPDILARFSLRYPKITFSVTMTDALADLGKDTYDLIVHSGRVPGIDMIGRRVKKYARSLCASPHYLDVHGMPEHPRDLLNHHCLVHSRAESRTWHFLCDESLIAQPLKAYVEVDSYPVLLKLAQKSMGIVRVSKALAEEDLASGRLVEVLGNYRSVNADGDVPGLWILHPTRHPAYRVQLFLDFLLEEIRI